MAAASSSRGTKRNASKVPGPSSKMSMATLLSPSLLLLEIPPDTNTSFPVWEAMRSRRVDIAWTSTPYSVSIHLTPVTSHPGRDAATSGTSESPSGEAPISVVVSGDTLQPQIVLRFPPRHHHHDDDASQKCVLLSFSPHSTPHLLDQCSQEIPPNPKPATSIMASLPLIITQPQPSHQPTTRSTTTTTTTATLPSVQTLMGTRATPSKALSPFHTKDSNVHICDNFLLNMCRRGRRCRMHHTPLPYHWQLRCVLTHQWVDVTFRAQVLMERMYCDVERETLCIGEGNVHCTLNFDSMEMEVPSNYDSVRRLANSTCAVRNPYFPTQWKIYWSNGRLWEEYNKIISKLLLKKIHDKESKCSFFFNLQEYKVDFISMTQTNVKTGYQRGVRRRPEYRSPASMHPYLQTGIQTVPASEPAEANFSVDPLEEFGSWYPPVWRLSPQEEDYSLVDVPAGTWAYRRIQNLFYESLPETKVDVIGIQQVQNLLHWDKYQRQKAYMQKHHTRSQGPLERHLYHGTSKEATEGIFHNNFDPRVAGVHGVSHGLGSYFSTSASYSNSFTSNSAQDPVRYMFLAKVLVGKVVKGVTDYRRPPPLLNFRTKMYQLYDTCVDDEDDPSIFVVFDSSRCYPYYLIRYQDLPKEIQI